MYSNVSDHVCMLKATSFTCLVTAQLLLYCMILLATELFSYSYILPKNKVIIIILHIILLCVHSLKLSHVKLLPKFCCSLAHRQPYIYSTITSCVVPTSHGALYNYYSKSTKKYMLWMMRSWIQMNKSTWNH